MGTPQSLDIAVEFLSSELIEGFRPQDYPDARKGWSIDAIDYLSAQLIEGFLSQEYINALITWGITTIEIGTPLHPIGDICTLDEAKEYLRDYLSHAALKLQIIKSWDMLNDHEKAAIFSFACNCGMYFYGSHNYARITQFLDEYPRYDIKTVFEVFLLYNSRGVLTRRRAREACLFVGIPWNIDNAKLDATIKYFSSGV